MAQAGDLPLDENFAEVGSVELGLDDLERLAQFAGDGCLALTGGGAAMQLSDHFVGQGPFSSAISATLLGDSDAFALSFSDQSALEFGERAHD